MQGFSTAFHRAWRVGYLLIVLVISSFLFQLSISTAYAQSPTASFDYTMPDHFGLDENQDGLIDYHIDPSDIQPSSYRVDFNACASTGTINQYSWSINGAEAGFSFSCDGFSYDFDEEGKYLVSLVVSDSNAPSEPVEKYIVVQNFLLIGLGDSYGSGEGNPDIPISVQLFSDTEQAFQDLEQAEADLTDAISNFTVAEINLEVRQGEIQPVQDALDTWSQECVIVILPTIDCPAAILALVIELTLFGVGEANDLVLEGFDAIQSVIDGFDDIAQTAYALADANLNLAQTAVDEARTLYNDLVPQLVPEWQNAQCHRSAFSGQAQAALMIEQADPRTSVTFVHLACSGAEIVNGMLGRYGGAESDLGPVIDPQVDQVSALIGSREIDGLIMSIGGNDANFAPILKACIWQEPCFQPSTYSDTDVDLAAILICIQAGIFYDDCLNRFDDFKNLDSADVLFDDGIITLDGGYRDLDARFKTELPGMPPQRVYITEYPNATRDENGNSCDFDVTDPLATIPGFSLDEGIWAESVVTVMLNQAVDRAARTHKWNYVGGIFDGFFTHGYCSTDHWLVRIHETFVNQGNINGVVHPTVAGQQLYGEQIALSLLNDLYPGGDLSQPRAPEQAPISLPGGPYGVAEGASISLSNDSIDPNGDQISYLWTLDMESPNTAALSNSTSRLPTLNGIDVGEGKITLRVTDASGYTSAATDITVFNVPPVVNATGQTDDEGSEVTLTVGFTDPGVNDTHQASIDWGDGSPTTDINLVTSPFEAKHTYSDDGIFTVKVTITDDDGGGGMANATMTILNVAPTVAAPDNVLALEGTAVSYPAIITDPGTDDSHSAVIDWGDGNIDNIPNVPASAFQHTYADNGLYTVLISVTDDDGGVGTDDGSVNVANVSPLVEVTASTATDEGSTASVLVVFTDPGTLDTHTAVVDWGDGNVQALSLVASGFVENHVYADDALYSVVVTVTDNGGGAGFNDDEMVILNVPPSVNVTGDSTTEGESATIVVLFSDPGSADTHTATVDWGDSNVENLGAVTTPFNQQHTYVDNGAYTVEVTVDDDDGGSSTSGAVVDVANAAPVVGLVSGLDNPLSVGEMANPTVSFIDTGVLDTHTAEWDWGDSFTSPGVVTEVNGSGDVTGSHSYAEAGIYTVTVTVTDNDGDPGQKVHQFAVVYDPTGGFITGNGWIDSLPGAYRPDPAMTGKATLAFVAKYKKGATVPIGQTQFRFQAARFSFHSNTYQWLVASGAKATFKGSGEVDGVPGYGFLISGVDGDLKHIPVPDKFRIKVWEIASGDIIYDNGSGLTDAEPSTELGAGNILIHSGKGN